MTLVEFNEYLDKMTYKKEYVVHIKQKYNHEKEYEEFNTLLLLEDDGTCVWEDDWNEGQQDVQILWFIAVDDVKQSEPEIIRCKDCNHWLLRNDGYCEIWEQYISNNAFYCGCGEKMEVI